MQTKTDIDNASEVRSEFIGYNSEILEKETKEKRVKDYVSIVELNLTTTPFRATESCSEGGLSLSGLSDQIILLHHGGLHAN